MPVMCIKLHREKVGMTQRRLAVEMGVDVSTVTKWETENALPKARDLPHLSKVLGCSIDELFVAEDPDDPDLSPDPDYYDTPGEE